jgi:hypothetical protein
MVNEPLKLLLHLDAGPDADEEEAAQLTQQLRNSLLDLDVDAVDPIHSAVAPARTKAVEAITLAGLAVTLAPIALKEVMKCIETWLARHDGASISFETNGRKITITGTPSKEQERIVEELIDRQNPGK